MVPGSQQFNRNWNLFMPCLIAPRFTMFLFFMASWLAAKRSWNPWQPCRGTERCQWKDCRTSTWTAENSLWICIWWYRMNMQVCFLALVWNNKNTQDLQIKPWLLKSPEQTSNNWAEGSRQLWQSCDGSWCRVIGQRTTVPLPADGSDKDGQTHRELVWKMVEECTRSTRHVKYGHTNKQTERTVDGGGGRHPRILPSFSSVWWSLEGFLRPDRHLPSRLKKFSSSSRPYSIALPSDSFTALVNLTWDVQKNLNQGLPV